MNRYWHFPLALLVLWAALFLVLQARSPIRWAEARGWYAQQGDAAPYRWTGNRLTLPLRPQTAPTDLSLTLAGPRWPGRAAPHVTLLAGSRVLAAFDAPELPTTYDIVVPPGSAVLALLSAAERSPFGDGRYLGVQVFDVQARARGFSWRAALEALAGAVLLGLGALALAWCLARGYGAQAGLLALALLARVFGPWRLPSLGPAEAASLADAINLLANGRDRFGQLLALGPGGTTPLLAYLQMPLVALLGPAPLASRVLAALAGALVAPVVYTCARRLRLPIAAALVAGLVAALPPEHVADSQQALALAGWAGSTLGALWFVQRANRASGMALALAAGAAWYADDLLRPAVLLLVVWAVLLVLLRHGRASFARWWPALALLALLWLPANYLALLGPGPATAQHAVAAARVGGAPFWWPASLQPAFMAAPGAAATLPGGLQGALAPLLALGFGLLAWRLGLRAWVAPERAKSVSRSSPFDWWLLLGALAIAPLPASRVFAGQAAEALLLGPLLALLAGAGAAVIWWAIGRVGSGRWRRAAQLAVMAALVALLCWQPAAWLIAGRGAPDVASQEQGLLEASALAAGYAAQADEIWVDAGAIAAPYVYVLVARALPPAESQALLADQLASGAPDAVTRLGKYRFTNLAAAPRDLPLLEVVPDAYGQSGFVLQRWDHGGRRVLVLRRLPAGR